LHEFFDNYLKNLDENLLFSFVDNSAILEKIIKFEYEPCLLSINSIDNNSLEGIVLIY